MGMLMEKAMSAHTYVMAMMTNHFDFVKMVQSIGVCLVSG